YFNNGDYAFAIDIFGKISKSGGKLVDYASFYFALSAYRNGQLELAKSMWLQMENRNKSWNGINEVYYWLSRVYFDLGEYDKGILYAKRLDGQTYNSLTAKAIAAEDSLMLLDALYRKFPNERAVALRLAD